MKKKFTKGEWHRDDKLIFAGDYFQTHIADVKDTYNNETATANAKLIVSAPDLLEVCESVLKWWNDHQYDTTDCGDRNLYDHEPDFVTKAKTAIKKALQ